MAQETSPASNREAVVRYYNAAEKGYWGDLGGVCHYGFSPVDHDGPFDMASAQIEMERILGRTLDLPPGSTVLDAGCGYGPVARTLAKEFGHEVTGIDLLPNRLRSSPGINRDIDVSPINLVNADYHDLPFPDESFDGVYTMETLVHADHHELVLSEFLRVLRPGGRVVLFEYSIPELDSIPTPARDLAERVIKNTGMASLPYFTHGSFPGILEKAGFENAQSVDISRNVYPSWFHLWTLALKTTLVEFSHGRVNLDNVPGSIWVWPARHKLGYYISQANKPV